MTPVPPRANRSSPPDPGRSRRRALVAAAAAIALGASGCGAGNPLDRPAAQVEGRGIDGGTIEQDLEDRSASPSFAGDATGQPEGTFGAAQTNQVVSQRITYELLGRALRQRQLVVSDDARQQAEDQLCSTTDQQGQAAADPACSALQGLPERYRNFLIDLNARGFVLVNDVSSLTPEEQQELFDEITRDSPEVVEARCYTVAVFTDPADAQAVAEGLAPGDDLGEAAADVSEQVQPDSCFGATDQAGLPPEVLAADVGDVVGPLQSGEGVVLLQRTADGSIQFEQFSQNIGILVFRAESADAEVRVDPRYGRWDRASQTVIPPDLPEGYEAPAATVIPGQ